MKVFLGAITSIVVIVGLLLGTGFLRFRNNVNSQVEKLFSQARTGGEQIVSADMLEGLPAPVQRFMTYTGVVGKPMANTVRLKMTGRIRSGPDQPWMPFDANEFYTVSPPTFLWAARASVAGLPLMRVQDHYIDGNGRLGVNVAGLFTLEEATGNDVDQGSLMRYLNEIMWFPTAFLADNVTWEAIDNSSARVTLTDRGESVSAVLYFDDEGRMTNFVGERYWSAGTEQSELMEWSTPISAYGEFEGLRLPVAGEGVWHKNGGDAPYTYIELQITDVAYNVPAP